MSGDLSTAVHFHGYVLTNVYLRISTDTRDQVVRFWDQTGAISDSAEARRRVDELVVVARNATGDVAGVNTVYAGRLDGFGPVYLYRSFVRPEDRRPGLSRMLLMCATDHLHRLYRTQALRADQAPFADQAAPRGLAFVAENEKLLRRGARQVLTRLGFRFIGHDARGVGVFLYRFDLASPSPSQPAR